MSVAEWKCSHIFLWTLLKKWVWVQGLLSNIKEVLLKRRLLELWIYDILHFMHLLVDLVMNDGAEKMRTLKHILQMHHSYFHSITTSLMFML